MKRGVKIAVVAAGVVAVGSVPFWVGAMTKQTVAAPRIATGTATVVRTDLATTTQAAGTLGFAGSYTIVNQAPGRAITALPSAGATLSRGEGLYEVDGSAIPLLYGARPMWRDLAPGVAPGPDVAQLNENLQALGYDTTGGQSTSADEYTWRTTAAVDAWQAARGLTQTGAVHFGDVVFEPGPLRIASVDAALGTPPQPDLAVAHATSATHDVVVQVPVTGLSLVHVGDHVTITLADGTTSTSGAIFVIGNAAVAPSPSSASGPGPATNNNPESDEVDVTIALTDPSAVAAFTTAAVTVHVTSASVHGVLAVPVNALLALAEGGYAVQVEDAHGAHLVGVRTGLFANSLVEVSGRGLAAGMRVEVPTS
jgi:peptidoglycan hydrolase-like protein with peptidoglycan-binding domain